MGLVCAGLFVETMFFAVLAPLLPAYVTSLDLSKTQAGILTGAYAAGAVAGAIPGGWASMRYGARLTLVAGLTVIAFTTIVFAFSEDALALGLARFGQGIGSALAWNGGLSWVTSLTGRTRRGEAIGIASAASIAGALFGPVLGAISTVVGVRLMFTAVGIVSFLLALWGCLTPYAGRRAQDPLRNIAVAFQSVEVRLGVWLVFLSAFLFGNLGVLGPLDLHDSGFTGLAIGGVFLLASAIEAGASPLLGKWSDRRGRLAPIRVGLIVALTLAIALCAADQPWLLATLVILSSVSYGMSWVPATAMMVDGAETLSLNVSWTFVLLNLAWAPGYMIGSLIGPTVSDAASDAASYGLVAALCLVTLIRLRGLRLPGDRVLRVS